MTRQDSTRQAPSREFAKWIKSDRAAKEHLRAAEQESFERFMRQHNERIAR